jgi:UDP-glucose 4-epimerase
LLAATHPNVVGETINLGQGEEISINSLARQVCAVAGRSAIEITHTEPRPGDVRRLLCDNTKAAAMLGFKPSIGLRDGLIALREWYLSAEHSPEQRLAEEVPRTWHVDHQF